MGNVKSATLIVSHAQLVNLHHCLYRNWWTLQSWPMKLNDLYCSARYLVKMRWQDYTWLLMRVNRRSSSAADSTLELSSARSGIRIVEGSSSSFLAWYGFNWLMCSFNLVLKYTFNDKINRTCSLNYSIRASPSRCKFPTSSVNWDVDCPPHLCAIGHTCHR